MKQEVKSFEAARRIPLADGVLNHMFAFILFHEKLIKRLMLFVKANETKDKMLAIKISQFWGG
jgi:hypothetical protein